MSIEKQIGSKIRDRRKELKLTQEDIAKALGVTSQQVHKYEKGIDRIPASSLNRIAKILYAPVTFFLEEGGAGDHPKEGHDLTVTCANLHGKKLNIRFLNLDVVVTEQGGQL